MEKGRRRVGDGAKKKKRKEKKETSRRKRKKEVDAERECHLCAKTMRVKKKKHCNGDDGDDDGG